MAILDQMQEVAVDTPPTPAKALLNQHIEALGACTEDAAACRSRLMYLADRVLGSADTSPPQSNEEKPAAVRSAIQDAEYRADQLREALEGIGEQIDRLEEL